MFTALVRLIGFRAARVLCFALFALVCDPAVRAQIGSSGIDSDPASGMRQGRNTIVRLSSVRVGEFSTMTDDNGVFAFRRLREGSYFITVEAGKDYLSTSETVDLFDNNGRTVTVQIQLRAKPTTANNKPAVVNATLAG